MDSFLIPALALVTLVIGVVIALRSKKATDERHDSNAPRSSLARREPDPNFLPDPAITDPHGVTRTATPEARRVDPRTGVASTGTPVAADARTGSVAAVPAAAARDLPAH